MAPEIKGLEFQRPDAVPFAQDMQFHFLNLLLEPDVVATDIEIELRKWADRFMAKEMTIKDIEIRQAVKKWPKDYEVKTPAVRAAQIMIDKGLEFFVGMKVGYVIVANNKDGMKVMPSELFDGEFDRNYYWTNKIIGSTARLVRARFQHHDFQILDSLEKAPTQQTFAFDSAFDEEAMAKRLPMKKPDLRKRKLRKTKPPIKPVTLVMREEDDPTENTIVGIKKLAEVADGRMRLNIRIILKNGDSADITTKVLVGQEFLDETTKVFPWVKVEHGTGKK
jgi:hypothetical protein